HGQSHSASLASQLCDRNGAPGRQLARAHATARPQKHPHDSPLCGGGAARCPKRISACSAKRCHPPSDSPTPDYLASSTAPGRHSCHSPGDYCHAPPLPITPVSTTRQASAENFADYRNGSSRSAMNSITSSQYERTLASQTELRFASFLAPLWGERAVKGRDERPKNGRP